MKFINYLSYCFILFIALPLCISATLGFALSPLQGLVKSHEPVAVLNASDIMI